MLETFLMTLGEMSKILILLAIGYLFNKTHLISRSAENVLSRFVTMLFLPCLTFYSNMMECKLDSIGTYGIWVLVGIAFAVGSLLLSYPTAKLFSKDSYQQGVFRYALTHPNTGAVATPLVLALFGTAGMFRMSLFGLVNGILIYSWGIAQLLPSHGKNTLWNNLKKVINPNFIAMISGMILGLLGAPDWMPKPIPALAYDLGRCYVPVALLMTGFSLADYSFSSVFHDIKIYAYTLWRLILMPILYLAILFLFKAPLELASILVLFYASPCGMNVVIFPAAYDQDCQAGSGLVLVSSIVSVFTVPLFFALVQHFFV